MVRAVAVVGNSSLYPKFLRKKTSARHLCGWAAREIQICGTEQYHNASTLRLQDRQNYMT